MEVLVRVGSHRSREKLFRLTGKMKGWWHWDQKAAGGFYRIPADKLAEARKIKGVTKVRDDTDFKQCWS